MSLVSQIQAQALDEESSTVELLRKALVVATKLRLDDFVGWCDRELNGYSNYADIPSYREVIGTVCAWNHITRRYDQVEFESAEEERVVSRLKLPYAISELEAYVHRSSKRRGQLHVNFAPEIQEMLKRSMNPSAPLSLRFEVAVCSRILDAVRNAILKWALQLERDGVLGEGMRFTKEEEAAASKDNGALRIDTYINQAMHIGTMNQSQVQTHPVQSPQSANYGSLDLQAVGRLVEEISKAVARERSSATLSEIRAELETLKAVISAPKAKHSWIADSLRSLKHMLEGAAGELIADGINAGQYIEAIGHMLGA